MSECEIEKMIYKLDVIINDLNYKINKNNYEIDILSDIMYNNAMIFYKLLTLSS